MQSIQAPCRRGPFESEFFGHMKGAFTDARTDRIGRFGLASGGTLFLDEIANIPVRKQAKLLRVLQTGEIERVGSSKTQTVNVRMISATNADLRAECAAGRFREDLLFRLNTVEINLPPLRDAEKISQPVGIPSGSICCALSKSNSGPGTGGLADHAAL